MRTLRKLLVCLGVRSTRLGLSESAGTPFGYTHAVPAAGTSSRRAKVRRHLGPWLGRVRRALWASGCGLPSTQACSAAYLVACAQDIVAVCHHFPVQEADERVLRAADGRRGRREENLQARHGRSRLLWGRKERSWQRASRAASEERDGESGNTRGVPFALGSVRTCAETQKPVPEIALSFVGAPGWNRRRRAGRFR